MSTALTFFNVSGDYQSTDDPLPQSTASTPWMGPIQALVAFTPRVPRGFTAFVDDFEISQDTNNQQTVQLIGAINGGTWGLNFGGVWINPYIAPSATAAQVQTALAALSSIGAGNVQVSGPAGGPYAIEMVGALANSPQPQLLADASNLTVSSGAANISMEMLNAGSASRVAPAAIGIPVRAGRIWTTGQLCAINQADSPNVELVSNIPEFGLAFDLIYDVTFTQVTYNGVNQNLAPFAFTAPVDATPICLTDPATVLLPYQPPLQSTWFPGWVPTTPPSDSGGIGVTELRTWRQAG
jgi:hypothetical protein